MSLMDTACSIPICLRKDDEQNANVVYSDNSASNIFTGREPMFPPYVSIFSQEEDETKQRHQIHNTFEVSEYSNHDLWSHVKPIIPNYNECCLWDNPNVTICGGTSRQKMAEALASGQGDQLLQISQLDPQVSNTEVLNQATDNEVIKNLKKIYDLYVEQKMPYIEHVRLLSLLPRSWSYEKTMELFGCSRHAIKIAHRMYDEQQYILTRNSEPSIRQRADPEKIKHFVNWLVESNTLVSGTYGLIVLRMDNGDKYELPKQVLQLQKFHALINYKKYCDETDFQGLGNSKLYDILNSIKSAQQRAAAGLDEFVVEGIEAWRSLSSR
ncbi:unnamed protein product [Rotaria sp. Silwood2]|nr:unnamed protein product [Rotaria sp. Silwood2]